MNISARMRLAGASFLVSVAALLIELGPFVRLLASAAAQMVDNALLRQSSKNPHGSGR